MQLDSCIFSYAFLEQYHVSHEIPQAYRDCGIRTLELTFLVLEPHAA